MDTNDLTAGPVPTPVGSDGSASPSATAKAGLVRTGTATLAILQRAVPLAARLVRVFDVYSWVVIGATATVLALVAALTRPVTVGSAVPYLVLVAVLAVPGVVLRLFHAALVEVLALPDWLRGSPELVRTHGTELAQLAGAAAVHSSDRLASVPRDIFRSGRLLMKAHGDLPDYGRMIRLVNLPFLFVVLVSFLAGFAVIFFAVLLVVTAPIALLVS